VSVAAGVDVVLVATTIAIVFNGTDVVGDLVLVLVLM
jgi:hypothetical protein